MNLLILSHMFPNRFAQHFGVFVSEQVKALGELGINITVISPIPYSPKILWLSSKWRNYRKIPTVENLDNKKIFQPRYLSFPKRIFFEKSGFFYYLGVKKLVKDLVKN